MEFCWKRRKKSPFSSKSGYMWTVPNWFFLSPWQVPQNTLMANWNQTRATQYSSGLLMSTDLMTQRGSSISRQRNPSRQSLWWRCRWWLLSLSPQQSASISAVSLIYFALSHNPPQRTFVGEDCVTNHVTFLWCQLTLQPSAYRNLLRRVIYRYELHVDNELWAAKTHI